MRLALTPLAVAVILAATALPVEIRSPLAANISLEAGFTDALSNLILFVPLGYSLWRFGSIRLFACAASLSLLIETLQLFLPGRYPSPVDVAANISGALLGALIARHRQGRRADITGHVGIGRRASVFVVACAALALLYIWIVGRSGTSSDFSNWDPTFDLALADELTHDRPWEGKVREFAVIPAPLDGPSIRDLAKQGVGSISANRRSFPEEPLFELESPVSLEAGDGQPLLLPSEGKRFCDALVQRGALTLLAWGRTRRLDQTGPARILTYSRDPWERNFTLAQEEGTIRFRLRTPATGLNGLEPEAETPAVLSADQDFFVAATYDGQVSRVYLNGHLVARENLSASSRFSPYLSDAGLPTVAAIVGGLLAAGLLGLARPRGVAHRWILGGLGGCLGGGLLLAAGGGSALPAFQPWVVVLSVTMGLVVSGSVIAGNPVTSDER